MDRTGDKGVGGGWMGQGTKVGWGGVFIMCDINLGASPVGALSFASIINPGPAVEALGV